jgi:hypothetical protein
VRQHVLSGAQLRRRVIDPCIDIGLSLAMTRCASSGLRTYADAESS